MPMSMGSAQTRGSRSASALWEANRRLGRSRLARVTVVGWRDGAGKLWTPNSIVSVQLPTAKIRGEDRLISEVTFLRSGEEGTQCVITVMPKEGLSPQPFAIVAPVPI
jgi:prophage tail gpP-like protein